MSDLWDVIKVMPIITFSTLLSSWFVAPMCAQRCENSVLGGFESCMGIIVSVWDYSGTCRDPCYGHCSILKARVENGKKKIPLADEDISICNWDTPLDSSPLILQDLYNFVTDQHWISPYMLNLLHTVGIMIWNLQIILSSTNIRYTQYLNSLMLCLLVDLMYQN